MNTEYVDYVVIGGGLAGSTAAYGLSRFGDVAVLAKGDVTASNSYWAQGGIAACMDPLDPPLAHERDTLAAGAGLCDPRAVRLLTSRASAAIAWLQRLGVPFDHDATGKLRAGLEGGHSHARIVHAGGDATGRLVMEHVSSRLAKQNQVVTYPNVVVTSLVRDVHGRVVGACGCRAGTANEARRRLWVARKGVILATGGIGGLYPYTSNPAAAAGDGLALAYHVGVELRNLEFVQFHPTILNVPTAPTLLISEAVRGAGGRLVDEDGRPLMANPAGDLQTRDVVARTIYRHQQESGPVFLDVSSIQSFDERFPTIASRLAEAGVNPITDLIPVTPAAHFHMGGVHTNLSGWTGVPGLYAVGEIACTGVHGANRLASNSLLECVVMAFELVRHLASEQHDLNGDVQADVIDHVNATRRPRVLSSVQEILWNHVGIERDCGGLTTALEQLANLAERYPNSSEVLVASLITRSALERTESRGAHYRVDYPVDRPEWAKDTHLSKAEVAYTHV